MDLTAIKCVPCQVGEPVLKRIEIDEYLKQVKGWVLEADPGKITKKFEFKDFKSAISFINKVADLSESEGHHLNIYLHDYKKVKIELWTHKIGGLHQNDFIMAVKIDKL